MIFPKKMKQKQKTKLKNQKKKKREKKKWGLAFITLHASFVSK